MGKSAKKKTSQSRERAEEDGDHEWELLEPYRHEAVIKRSRFIACAGPVSSVEEALAFIERSSERDARHNCWAYMIDGQEFRSSDDGEPGGTAGRPILTAIGNARVVNVAVCVVRYFGGIKLGAGGLVRAYGGTTRDCLKQAPKRLKVKMEEFCVDIGFEDVGALANLFAACCKVDSEFNEHGASIRLRLPQSKVARFKQEVNDATKGRAIIKEVSPIPPGSS